MASRFLSLYPQPLNSTPSVYAGGKLLFYASETSSPLATYSDEGLSIANANPIILNSAGFPDVAIFLQNRPYKVVLKDSNDITNTTVDPYYVTDLKSVCITKVCLGSPSGVVEGTAGSPGVLATQYWDAQNFILYFCTTTGSAATAQWTTVNASAAIPTVVQPQGYLTLTSGTPVITGDVNAATPVFYTPFTGNLILIYNGSRHVPTEFTELTLDLVSAHAVNAIYDVLVFSNNGVLTAVTGPAWTTATAGSGARGTGAGTTQLSRLNGYWVNTVSMTGRNGSSTYSIGANLATYVGSIFMDGTNGQVSCHMSWGQSRKWGVWNCFNRQPIYLKAGDSTASWTYGTNALRTSNNATANSLTVFSGLPEERYHRRFGQKMTGTVGAGSNDARTGIGWNSTSSASGRLGYGGLSTGNTNGANMLAEFQQVPSLGINVVTALETCPLANGNITWFGGEDDMILSAQWRG
jgi:hypothetical protein